MEGDSLSPDAAAGQAVVGTESAPPGPQLLDSNASQRLLIGAAVGAFVTLVALFVNPGAGWAGLTMAGQLAVGLGLGGVLFVAFGTVTSAGWTAAIRRVPEAMSGTLPFGAGLVLVALLISLGGYEWSHADAVKDDALLTHKSPWLNPVAVILRTVVFLGIWVFFARVLRRLSMRQDTAPDPRNAARTTTITCIFLGLFALSFSFASFDWIMSLEAHWFSTVFAIYTFSGMFLAALAVLTLLLVWLRRRGHLARVLRDDHLHDIGKLTFGFATFWAYIWFCQYMLIWYSNIPEEATYYVTRMNATWGPWMIINLVINWLAPFLLLLPAAAKRNERTMVRVAWLLVIGRVLDLHLLIAPPLTDSPWTILWELAPVAAAGCGFVWFFNRSLTRAPIVPENDVYMAESLSYHS